MTVSGDPDWETFPPMLTTDGSTRLGDVARLEHSIARYSICLQTFVYLPVSTRIRTGRNPQRGEKRGAVADQEPRRLTDAPNETT